MRHGDAVVKASNDLERHLTDKGRNDLRIIASFLREKLINIDIVLVSPYLRAIETLESLRKHMVLPSSQKVMSELIPNGNAQLVCSYIYKLNKKGISSLLLISHLPLISYIVAYLCPQEPPLVFIPSAVVCINLAVTNSSQQLSTLIWKMQPPTNLKQSLIA
ncbi:Phosphohistidine phosphatase SixA [Candidatus Palibaumannia cicadellinicola]|uniref:Phosphohistidine phosphatase SixA n=2 Tax=Candidatus Palibaumannia cicadellinicola TaxID=186490 RepID=A0A0K2BKP0_9GAMM|nr:Phosphohistidine phosphatase SixA [Candidatus Baumannia cicadellinicola]